MKSVLLYIEDELYDKLKVFSKKKELSIVSAINEIVKLELSKDTLENTIDGTEY